MELNRISCQELLLWVNSRDLAKEACHSMKLMRGRRLFPSFPGCVFLRWVNWTREQFLGVLVTMEMAAFAANPGFSPVIIYMYGYHIFTFLQDMRVFKISSVAFSQSRDTSSSLLHLTLGLGKWNSRHLSGRIQSISWILLKWFPMMSFQAEECRLTMKEGLKSLKLAHSQTGFRSNTTQ